ncbi:MAG: lipopolysaccharide heptosyltransferase II [Methylococcales bacterium]|nr:lipopolysaccharide heptosyltransferase II [Methylococcales bacterium]
MRILIIGASWIGDMVMAQSLFITLKSQQPDCEIDVLAPKWTFGLLARIPEVHKAIEMPLGHGKLGLLERIQLGKQLQSKYYDRAYLLPNSWKSALTPFFANIPLRIGYTGECRWGLLNDRRTLDKKIVTQTVQRFVALAYPDLTPRPHCPPPKLSSSKTQQQNIIKHFKLNLNTKILVLCAGAEFGKAKRWPLEYYARVANHFLNNHWQVWLIGSEKDSVISAKINQKTHAKCYDFTGKTTIADAVDLIALADAVVANDSGLMHIAAGLNKKLIAIYGASDPDFTPPLNEQAKILHLGLSCSPCFKRECPLTHYNCLTGIKPAQVINALASFF